MTVTAKPKIEKCSAREILDSRGNPTVEAVVYLEDGSIGIAAAPSGASTGQYEAHEKRDGNRQRYRGKGVLETVSVVQSELSPALKGLCASDQFLIDRTLRNLDGSENKSHYGANVLLALALANARAESGRAGRTSRRARRSPAGRSGSRRTGRKRFARTVTCKCTRGCEPLSYAALPLSRRRRCLPPSHSDDERTERRRTRVKQRRNPGIYARPNRSRELFGCTSDRK